jgi:hypothetical protein
VARICFRALEALQKVPDTTEERYGAFGRERIKEQISYAMKLCNPERHAKPSHEEIAFDRTLALHTLNTTISLTSVILK